MSPSENLPAAAFDLAISFLLPLILPTLDHDAAAARALALHMLGEYNPQSARELRLAAEAIGFSLKSLAVLAESAEPGLSAGKLDALKWACSLSRSGHQAQRRLMDFQRASRTAPEAAAEPTPEPATEHAAQPEPEQATPDIATAEARLATATKLLNLLKAHHKGAPPPHSSAAQQIQAQQRIVETARLKLEQARRLQTAAPQPEQQAA